MNEPHHRPGMGRSAFAAGIAQVLGRISGLFRDVVFAAVFGAGSVADTFFVAFRVPNMFRELLAEGTLSNVFVPLFAKTTEKDGAEKAWALANALLGLLLVLLGFITIGIYVFSEPLVWLVASGFEDTPGKVETASWLTRILAPFLAGISIASLLGGMLNVRGRFFLPALAPALLNVAIILACLLDETWTAWTGTPAIGAVAFAATVSGLASAAIQYPTLHRLGFRFRPTFSGHPEMKRIIRFMGAALVGVVVVQFNLLVETQLASQEGDGAVSWIMLGFRLVQIPMSVIAGSIAVAALAQFSINRAQENDGAARETLGQATESMMLLVIPAAVGLYILAHPLVALCFERGAFTANDTIATAAILQGYAFAVVGICAYRLFLPIFFALGDPYLPMKLSLVVMAAKIPVALALMQWFGLMGLPLSHAVTVSLETLVMVVVLHRRLHGWKTGMVGQLGRIVLASAFMGVGVVAIDGLLPAFGSLRVILLCAIGAGLFAAFAWVLKIRAVFPLLTRLRRRIAPPPPPRAE